MNFKSFMENNIQFARFSNDGTVVVYINDKQYTYVTDAAYHDRWKKMARFQPFKVLNDIKFLVSRGQATVA